MHSIWSINAKALQVFLDLSTQWRIVNRGARLMPVGLDYGAAIAVFGFCGIDDIAMLDDLRAMEDAALDAFGEVAR